MIKPIALVGVKERDPPLGLIQHRMFYPRRALAAANGPGARPLHAVLRRYLLSLERRLPHGQVKQPAPGVGWFAGPVKVTTVPAPTVSRIFRYSRQKSLNCCGAKAV
jgi:hypothetical protein